MQSKFVSKFLVITLNFARKDCKVFIGTSCSDKQKRNFIIGEFERTEDEYAIKLSPSLYYFNSRMYLLWLWQLSPAQQLHISMQPIPVFFFFFYIWDIVEKLKWPVTTYFGRESSGAGYMLC